MPVHNVGAFIRSMSLEAKATCEAFELSFPDSVVEAKNKVLADDMRSIGAIHIPWAPPPSTCHDPP